MKLRAAMAVTVMACLSAHVSFVLAQAPSGPPSGAPPGGMPSLGPKIADAKPNELRVIVSGSLQGALESARAEAERAAKWPLIIQGGAARGGLRDELLAGQEFEVAILVPDVNQELVQKGLARNKTYEVARVPVAIGLLGEAPPPDIGTPAALKKALLGAKSVRYQVNGAGHPTVRKMLSGLGIENDIKDATKMARAPNPPGPPGPPAEPSLAPGEYALWIFPVSEIMMNRNLKNLGPVIDDFQVPVIIEAVIGARAKDIEAAEALIAFLRGPEFEQVLKKNGMMKGK